MRIQSRSDEVIRAYVLAAQLVFDALHEVSTRLAGLLMSAEMLKSRHVLDVESREVVRERLAEARADHARLKAPDLAAHFHHHLTAALEKLGTALGALDARLSGLVSAVDPLPPLRSAWKDIEAASRAMPGFETVDFQQSCCALHGNLLRTNGGVNGRVFNLDA